MLRSCHLLCIHDSIKIELSLLSHSTSWLGWTPGLLVRRSNAG
jgi:hypothetical protein